MPSIRSLGRSCLVVCLVLGLPAAGMAAQDASVSGTVTANGETVYLPEAQTVFDDTFQYDFTSSAPLSDPNAPIGEPLPAEGGEPGRAYIAWVNAIHSGDVEQLKALVPAEVASQFDSPEAKEEIEMMQSMTPTQQKILGGSSDGQTALLQVEGVMEGETVQGEITLEKVGEHWRATTASW